MSSCCHRVEESGEGHYGYVNTKRAYVRRLSRIEGQIRGIKAMLEDEKYCIDILTQISAVTGALRALALLLVDDHLSQCVVRAVRSSQDETEVKLAEISDVLARLMK